MMTSAQVNITDDAYLELRHMQVWQRNLAVFVYVIVIGAVGLVGNSLTLLVYSRKQNKSATHVFIIALAIVDLTTDVIFVPVILCVLWHAFKVDASYLCKLFYFLNFSTATISVVLLVAIAYVRYRKVCHSYGRHISKKTAKGISLLIVAVCLVACIPHYIVQGRQTIDTDRAKVNGHLCRVDDDYVETMWPKLVYGVFTAIFLMCSSALTFMYSRIGVVAWRHGSIYGARVDAVNGAQEPCSSGDKSEDGNVARCSNNHDTSSSIVQLHNLAHDEKGVANGIGDKAVDANIRRTDSSLNFSSLRKKRKNWREKSRSASARQGYNARTTRMLLVITAIYILSNLTSLLLILVRTVSPDKHALLGTTEASIFNFFVASYLINTAANPIVYSVCDRNFRLQCRNLVK